MADIWAWQTTNTKLASCLGLLKLPLRTQVTQDARSGGVNTQFFVGDQSVGTGRVYVRDFILAAWKKGTLETQEPLHPFLQGLRSEHNYDMLLDAQKQGRRIRLVGVAGSQAAEYRDGEELPEMLNATMLFQLADLSLVAALGTLGIPCIKMEWNGKHHLYTLPVEGHPLKQRDGSIARYNGLNLAVRAEPGRSRLQLEDRDPDHPLVSAYGARQVHGQILKHLKDERRLMLVRPQGTLRSAIITDHPSHRVEDIVARHFKT